MLAICLFVGCSRSYEPLLDFARVPLGVRSNVILKTKWRAVPLIESSIVINGARNLDNFFAFGNCRYFGSGDLEHCRDIPNARWKRRFISSKVASSLKERQLLVFPLTNLHNFQRNTWRWKVPGIFEGNLYHSSGQIKLYMADVDICSLTQFKSFLGYFDEFHGHYGINYRRSCDNNGQKYNCPLGKWLVLYPLPRLFPPRVTGRGMCILGWFCVAGGCFCLGFLYLSEAKIIRGVVGVLCLVGSFIFFICGSPLCTLNPKLSISN